VETAVQRTQFPESCKSQNVEVTFRFRLEGEPSEEPKTAVVFNPPNEYVVTSNVTPRTTGLDEKPAETVRSCSTGLRFGRRIVSRMGLVEFRVPLSAHVIKGADVDYVSYHIRYGPKGGKIWLKMMFSCMGGGNAPDNLQGSSIRWTAIKWSCGEKTGGADWRGIRADGHQRRHVSLPFGFAAYEGMPPEAADYFDRVLDSMCCGSWKGGR